MTENLFLVSATKLLSLFLTFLSSAFYCCYKCFFHLIAVVISLEVPVLESNLPEASEQHAWVQVPAQPITLTLSNLLMIHPRPFSCVLININISHKPRKNSEKYKQDN